ncbi:MAG: 30S ribosomal protein S6 [Acidimicrobiales bacterium]|jgi:small subunit ribosomal protein S6
MRVYELVVILESSLDDDEIQEQIDKISSLVSAQDGSVLKIDRWGRKRFAYELKDRWEGYYVIVQLKGEPKMVAEVERNLYITDEVLRHKISRLPVHVAEKVLSRVGSTPSTPSED